MKYLFPLLLLALSAAPADAQRRVDQRQALEARREGRLLPLREIERRIVPTMGDAQYLGVDFDSVDVVYTLKFLRDGAVIWVVVDGQTGHVLRRLGQ